jgi:hypothetical protein
LRVEGFQEGGPSLVSQTGKESGEETGIEGIEPIRGGGPRPLCFTSVVVPEVQYGETCGGEVEVIGVGGK